MPENTAKTASEWVFIARSVAKLPDGQNQALRCMAQAGMSAQDVTDWLEVAQAWAQDFNDSEMAQQYMSIAESQAEDSDDWIQIAKIWKEKFQDSDNAIQCMENAEDAAGDVYHDHNMRIGQKLKKVLGDIDSASMKVELTPHDTEYVDDKVRIAKIWYEDFHDSDIAFQCLESAVWGSFRGHFYAWTRFARIWNKEFPDSDMAIRCMREAEMVLHDLDALDTIERAAFVDLGDLTGSAATRVGTWGSECVSERRPGSYARYYSFTLAQAAEIVIDLTSDVDTYLYLLNGGTILGDVLDDTDDVLDDTDDVLDDTDDVLYDTNSRIIRFLDAGTYTVEATTYSEMKGGAFNLKIYIPK